jgi:hypothetical protein
VPKFGFYLIYLINLSYLEEIITIRIMAKLVSRLINCGGGFGSSFNQLKRNCFLNFLSRLNKTQIVNIKRKKKKSVCIFALASTGDQFYLL